MILILNNSSLNQYDSKQFIQFVCYETYKQTLQVQLYPTEFDNFVRGFENWLPIYR